MMSVPRYKSAKNPCTAFWRECVRAIFRTKKTTNVYRKLSTVLNMFDVTMLGLGTTIGMGSYIFIGHYAKEIGPAMTISHSIAALISFMNALCYAEFVSREPGSGGAYSQAYYLLGEFVAALIGWLLIMENVFGSALSARGLSEVIDSATGERMSDFIKGYVTFSTTFLASYPDFVAFFAEFIILTFVSFGLKEVTRLNNFIVGVNLSVLVMILVVSGSNMQFSNWSHPPSKGCGNGGFMPYGLSSIWHGVSKVFYAYIGFDAAAHAGSEIRDPERGIPVALLLSVIIVTTLYLFQSFTYTLLWPYCDQDLSEPIQYTMEGIGMDIMMWVTTIGCPIGLIGNLICSTYPLTRLLHAIAEDGLIYPCMAHLNIYTKTPINAMYIAALLTAIFALLFDKFQLAEVSCLGALGAYCLVAMCILTLRYSDEEMDTGDINRPLHKIIFNMNPAADRPTVVSSLVVLACSTIVFLTSFPSQLLFAMGYEYHKKGQGIGLFLCTGVILFYCLVLVIILNQPLSKQRFGIQIFLPPCLRPMLPFLCMLINANICCHYSVNSWIILTIWMSAGTFVYFSYGIWKSKARGKDLYLGQ